MTCQLALSPRGRLHLIESTDGSEVWAGFLDAFSHSSATGRTVAIKAAIEASIEDSLQTGPSPKPAARPGAVSKKRVGPRASAKKSTPRAKR